MITDERGFNMYGVKRCENPNGLCFNTIYSDGHLYARGKYCSEECMGDARSVQMKKSHKKGVYKYSQSKSRLSTDFLVFNK